LAGQNIVLLLLLPLLLHSLSNTVVPQALLLQQCG
jgi:hypothetical protein